MSSNYALDDKAFEEAILNALNHGYGFIPLTGSGISAASGILMGVEFANYLAYATYRAVVRDKELGEQLWDFRTHGWPTYPEPDQVRIALE